MTITAGPQAAADTFQLSGQQLTNMLDSISDGFIAFDRDWRFTFINRAAASILTSPAEKLIGRQLWEAFPEFGATGFGQACRRAAAEGVSIEHEDYYPPRAKWFAIRAYPWDAGMSVYIRDITEQKRAEQTIVESNVRCSALMEHLHDLVGVVTTEGTLVSLNSAFEQITGWSRDKYIGTPFPTLIHPDDRAAAEHHFQKLLSGEAAQFVELRLLHRTGMYRWIEFSAFPQFENGVITHLWGIGRDITERKQTNQALHQIVRQNSQLATAIASTTTGVVISDPHLPDIPGAEVLHRLQNAPDTRAIPVVVINASGMQPQIQRLLAAGAYTYLTKPINIKRLLATIDAIIQLANKGI